MKRKFHVGFGKEGACFLLDESQARQRTLTSLHQLEHPPSPQHVTKELIHLNSLVGSPLLNTTLAIYRFPSINVQFTSSEVRCGILP